jgi:hypothetical protein
VLRAAQHTTLDIEEETGHACLKGESCSVFAVGRYTGVTLVFNGDDILARIRTEPVRENGVISRIDCSTVVNMLPCQAIDLPYMGWVYEYGNVIR